MKLQRPGARGWIVALVLALVVIVGPMLVPHAEEHEAWWSSIPAWWAIFGLLAASAAILLSALLGWMFLEQGEDFYGEGSEGGDGLEEEGGRDDANTARREGRSR